MSQVKKDIEQDISNWVESHGNEEELTDAGKEDVAGRDGGDVGKEVINVDDLEEKMRKQIASRSNMRQHFTKIKVDGVVVKGKCNYCDGEIMAHSVHNVILMSLACPQFNLPSRRTCTRDTVQLYFEQKTKLKIFFQEQCLRVCLTTDGWTSQQQDSYMTVTASFIDNNWCLHKKIINFKKVLLDWGLDKVMTVTVDNASANDSGVSYLRRQMNSLKTSIARSINLIVQDGLKEVDNSIKLVRAAVRFVKNGTSRLVKFRECARSEKVDSKAFLSLDVCTWWNSTHDMLAAACTYEKVFTSEIKLGVSSPGVPGENDWDNARKLTEFLGHFADVTRCVSASLNGNLDVQNEKGKGKEKEKENINLIFVAIVLDPRYKLSEYIELAIEEIYGEGVGQKVWAAVTKCLHDLFEEYRDTNSQASDVNQQSSDSPQSKQGGDCARKMKTRAVKRMRLNNGSSSCSRGSRTELDRYLAEEYEEDTKKFDILACTSGRILDDFRSSLTPFMVEALVCTQDWLRRATPIDIAENT
uniref:hAT-like transposase RNase-H fold domain-containing protein n=1 Tax=Setaria italica TaxID=4555 RepID=K3ZLP8_SETIT